MSDQQESGSVTAGELWRRRARLEKEAATLLGRFILGFSSLEFSVLLLIQSLRRESAIPPGGDANLKTYIESIRKFVKATNDLNQEAKVAYEEWVNDVDDARVLRNALIHGRWVVDSTAAGMQNITTDAKTGVQSAKMYTTSDLRRVGVRLSTLQERLSRLRTKWPT